MDYAFFFYQYINIINENIMVINNGWNNLLTIKKTHQMIKISILLQ